MDEGDTRPAGRAVVMTVGRSGLAVRLLATVAIASAAALVAERALADLLPDFALRVAVSAVAGSALIGSALWRLVVRPLEQSREDLNVRYEAALADALTDPLTGLGNHRAFQEELDRQIEAVQRYEVPLSLVVLDLDEFKAINDLGGHAEGDRTLAYFGRLLGNSVRKPDRAFRIGGDEFAILLPHTECEGARIVTRRLLANALQPVLRLDDQPKAGISFSAGVSSLPEPATTRAQLYAQADAALYQAKRAGRTEVVVFDPLSASEEAVAEGSAGEVASVISQRLLRPVYQPIIDLAGARQIGMEGLIRPTAPAPFANPSTLFAAARASGHVLALDLACVDIIVAGARAIEPDQFLAVNLSPASVQAPDFSAAGLLAILANRGFPPERLVLELTEREEIADLATVRERLEACRRAGMRLSADDVGAGNSGLRLLSELQFDFIKVDLSLVQRSPTSAASSAVIESVVALASRTGALVIGEGVEETTHLAKLGALGVTAAQGYLLGRPEPLAPVAPRAALGVFDPMPSRPVPAAAPVAEVASPMSSWRHSIGLPAA